MNINECQSEPTVALTKSTKNPIFMIFVYGFHPYLRHSWTNFHDFWICFSSISQEFMDQFSWFLDMFFINISGIHGPIFIIFGHGFHQYLRNSWTDFHDFWICFSSIIKDFMEQFLWFLEMFFIHNSGFHGTISMIFGYAFHQYLRN